MGSKGIVALRIKKIKKSILKRFNHQNRFSPANIIVYVLVFGIAGYFIVHSFALNTLNTVDIDGDVSNGLDCGNPAGESTIGSGTNIANKKQPWFQVNPSDGTHAQYTAKLDGTQLLVAQHDGTQGPTFGWQGVFNAQNAYTQGSGLSNTCIITPSSMSLADGTHTLAVTEINPNASNVIPSFTFTVDTTPPPPVVSGPKLADISDKGVFGDNITNINAPKFVGISGSGIDTQLLRDGSSGAGGDPGCTFVTPSNPNPPAPETKCDAIGRYVIATTTTANGTHSYQAYTQDSVGNQSAPTSPPIQVTIDAGNPPTVPQNFRATATTSSSISLAWNASTDTGGAIPASTGVYRYNIWRSVHGLNQFGSSPQAQVSAGTTTYTDNINQGAGTSFDYYITAEDIPGNLSANSSTVTGTLGTGGTITGPTNVQAALSNPITLHITWTAATGPVSYYRIYDKSICVSDSTGTCINVSASAQSYDATVSPNSGHSIFIIAFDSSGNNGPTSNTASVSPYTDTTPPSPVTTLTATYNTASNSVTLNWPASTDNSGLIAKYIVYKNNAPCSTCVVPSLSSTAPTWNNAATTFTDTNVVVNTSYTYSIYAQDWNTNLSVGNINISFITDGTPPSAPSNLVPSSGSSGVALSWGASTDNFTVKSYNIYRNGSLLINQSAIYGTSYFDSTGNPGQIYTYYVTAIDQTGNESGPSNSVQGTKTGTAKIGDITGPTGTPDGKVDIYDLNMMLTNYGTNNSVCDINKSGISNGIVDIFDLSTLLTNYGR